MTIQFVACTPFQDQKPGTSGLRKKTRRFQEPHYLETFVQAIFTAAAPQGPLVVGGDGRHFNAEAIQTIVRIAIANGCRHLIIGQNGLLSTPAASHLVRKRQAAGAVILSASHNPAGPDGDFGVKFNGPNGAPAAERLTNAIFEESRRLEGYRILAEADLVDLSRPGILKKAGATLEIVDSTRDYADLMETLFDFDLIRARLSGGLDLWFDGMNAVTGPYAREILHRRLGVPEDQLLRAAPLTDFGHAHPDPTAKNAPDLVRRLAAEGGGAIGAASDGDGDRHLILGAGFPVNPSDSLAILTRNAEIAPGYRGRMAGVARSMPTSRAVDRVAERLGLPCFETPTGWKFFGSLLDAGKITLCGEESAGAGSDHVREKDGVWALLFWLNILAARGGSVQGLVEDHWRDFGRNACLRLDYDDLPSDVADRLMSDLKAGLPRLAATALSGDEIAGADVFDYVDPVTGDLAQDQGVRIHLTSGGRIVYRLSGTGTAGATLRVYLERYVADPHALGRPAEDLVRPVEDIALALARIPELTGRSAASARV